MFHKFSNRKNLFSIKSQNRSTKICKVRLSKFSLVITTPVLLNKKCLAGWNRVEAIVHKDKDLLESKTTVYCRKAPKQVINPFTAIFLGSAQSRMLRQIGGIYTYHKIAPPPQGTRDPFLYVSPGRFDDQLAQLRRQGFKSSKIEELAGGGVVISFDDGFENVLRNGLEPLGRHGFQGLQYIVSDRIGGLNDWDIAKGDTPERLMDQAQIREWIGAGHAIGSHSRTHRNLRKLSRVEARSEIVDSKKALEDMFGVAVRHFCHPYGGFTAETRELVMEAGYQSAVTVLPGFNPPGSDRYALRRIIPLSAGEFVAKVIHRVMRKLSSTPSGRGG
jgi:peptidoglycan/xylan/chitin deacetylase (PgdA/CDA1 family)